MRVSAIAVAFLCLHMALNSLVWGQEAPAAASGESLALDQLPLNMPYPGVLQVSVDATDTARHILRVREVIPVSEPGPMTLLYPRWLPGNHRPAGRIDELAGLTISAAGQTVRWTRDTESGFSFAIDVPQGASELEIGFQIVTPVTGNQGRVVMTPEMLNLQWNKVVLYPAGHYASQVTIEPSIRLPDEWHAAIALEPLSNENNVIRYRAVSLETLVDSPMFAGINFERVDLDPGGEVPFYLNIVADDAADITYADEHIETHRALVQQAYRLFQSRHFDHYDFLLALTDTMSGIGLEHHQSSENAVPRGYFTEWDSFTDVRDLLPHELVHSWNGKFRRPADLWAPNFNVPMRDSLLWVYEGQTQYWGYVLSARSGLWTQQEALDGIAWIAAIFDTVAGRQWRPLQDTTNDPILSARRPMPWRSWQRREDYYSEGQLIWLDVDTLIRELSGDTRSLDDFTATFFGVDDGSYEVRTYRFENLVEALNSVQPYDWEAFLRSHLDRVGGPAPLDGIARGGYRLVYTEEPSEHFSSSESRRGLTDLWFSLGIVIGRDNTLSDVLWEGPAFDEGLTVGNEIIAVDGLEFSRSRIRTAVGRAAEAQSPIKLIVRDGAHYRTLEIPYFGGLRYPHLERSAETPARLDDILATLP